MVVPMVIRMGMMLVMFVMFMVFMVIMPAGAALVMLVMMVPMAVPGTDDDFAFHSPGDLRQLGDQTVRVLGGEPELFRGEGDRGFLHLGQGIEFGFDLGGAVGAVQIFEDVDLLLHGVPSRAEILTYEHTLKC